MENKNLTYEAVQNFYTGSKTISDKFNDHFKVCLWLNKFHNTEVIVKSWKEGGKIVYLYSVNELGKASKYRLDTQSATYEEALEKGLVEALNNLNTIWKLESK